MHPTLQNKRIILAANDFVVGGLQNQAILLARYLQEQGAHVQILGYGKPEPLLVQRLDEHNIPWKQIPYPWKDGVLPTISSLWRFAKNLRHERPDVIIPFSGPSNLACNLVWKFTGANVCIWNQRNAAHEPLTPLLVKIALRLTTHCTSNNELGTEYIRTHGASATTYIPDAIDPAQPSAPAQNLAKADFTAAMVANFTPAKDHLTLIKAWAEVERYFTAKNLTCHLFLAGSSGETYAQAQKMVAEKNLEKSITFLGLYPSAKKLFKCVTLCAHSAFTEGGPNAVQEAMQAGLAVAATNIPGTANLLTIENKPYLSPVQDSKALAENIITLFEHPEERRRIGLANSKQSKQYALSSIGAQYATLLTHLLSKQK